MEFVDGPNDGEQPSLEDEFQAYLDRESTAEQYFEDFTAKIAASELHMLQLLRSSNFPFAAQILQISENLDAQEKGLSATYDYFVNQIKNPEDSFKVMFLDTAQQTYQQKAYLMSTLVVTVQHLANAKCGQDSCVESAADAAQVGDHDSADSILEYAFELRKEIEAKLLLDESLGVKTATKILEIVGSEFVGDSLLPLTEASESYIIVYRMNEDRSDELVEQARLHRNVASSVLETMVSVGQKQHPDYSYFAGALSRAIALSIIEDTYTLGHSDGSKQLYESMISDSLRDATKTAAELGIRSDTVIEYFETILSKLTEK